MTTQQSIAITVPTRPNITIQAGYQNGGGGGTDAGALRKANNLSDLSALSTAWSNLGFGQTINVKHWGATGDGVTDDTAAIQAAIDGSAVGSTIFFPGSTYLISSTIKLKEQRHYLGDMYQGGTIIKQKNSANMTTPMLAAELWYTNGGASNGVLIENLAIDGNKANNSSSTADGLLLCNWQSAVRNVHVYNCKGSGIVLTDAVRSGSAVAGTVIENRIENCRISTVDGRGIYVWEQSGSGKLTDGFCLNNIVNGAQLEAIYIQRAAGWRITGNHCYTGTGLGQSSIWAKNCFSTRITENYIDNYGQTATTGFYSGIRAEITTTRGSVIANNTISCTEDTAGSTYRHLYVLASSSITTARAVVAGNVINGTSQTNGTGIRIEAGSGTNFSVHVYGNKVDACNTSFTGVATGTLTGRFDLYGSGSPEGVITAPIGATYTRSDGGSATTLYVKESGTGNTGWTAVGASGVTSVDGNTGAVTASQLLTSIKTVDGSGSGLDADLLDGISSAGFAQTANNLSDLANAGTARTNLGADNASNLASGTVPTARLGSGSASSSTFLRGDQSWAAPSVTGSGVTIADAGNYYPTDTVEAALQQLGPSLSLSTLQKLTAGITVPTGALDRWKAGRGLDATFLAGAMDNSQTNCAFIDSSIIHDTSVAQVVRIEDEEVFVTATSAGRSVSDGVTTSSSTTVTSATASFASTDVGRVITGSGIPRYTYIASVTNSTTAVLSAAATATASSVTFNIGARHTIERGINGTTAASHATLVECRTARHRRVAHLGDSIAEGVSTSTIVAGDGWSVRAARTMGNRLGGVIGQAWPMWRNTSTLQVHQEYVLTGASTVTGGTNADVGWGTGSSSLFFTGSGSNGWVWTRPAGVRVQTADILWLDNGTTSCNWSYSTDGGSTWTTNPQSTTIYSSGKYLMRRTRLTGLDDPTTIRVRAADSGGTSKTCYFPYGAPLVTYSTPINMGWTEGVVWANFGFAGSKLRSFLNSRTFTDAVVTNGSTSVTSATATFVSADANSTVYIEGVAYTISSVTNSTTIVLGSSYAGTSGSSKRITVFQDGGTASDKTGTFLGHYGSLFPDLVIVGPFTNDMGLATVANGDTNENAMYDMLTYLVGKLKTLANVLLIAPYELNSYDSTLQSNYRAKIELVASEQSVASLNLYAALSAYGVTGYTAANSGGYMADGAHLSALGNRWMGSHLARVLEIV